MPSHGLFLIGTNLLVLAHVHSFVLLSANYNDVKKLAQKFVSESIAEQIAEFVAKATGAKTHRTTSKEINVPKSRDPLGPNVMSEEDKETNVKESISNENVKYNSNILINKKPKERIKSKFLNPSDEDPDKENEKMKGNKKIDMEYIFKNKNFNDFSEDSANNNVSVESTAAYQDDKGPDKDLTSDQYEEPAYNYDFRLKKSKEGRNNEENRLATLTTRKQKIEFDQYDNTNYPKAVATSGSLTLKRLLDTSKSKYRDPNISDENASS